MLRSHSSHSPVELIGRSRRLEARQIPRRLESFGRGRPFILEDHVDADLECGKFPLRTRLSILITLNIACWAIVFGTLALILRALGH